MTLFYSSFLEQTNTNFVLVKYLVLCQQSEYFFYILQELQVQLRIYIHNIFLLTLSKSNMLDGFHWFLLSKKGPKIKIIPIWVRMQHLRLKQQNYRIFSWHKQTELWFSNITCLEAIFTSNCLALLFIVLIICDVYCI